MRRLPIVLDANLDKEIARAKVDFDVEMRPAFTRHGDEFVEIPNRRAVVRTDTGAALGVVSKHYTLVEHKSLIDIITGAVSKLDVGQVPMGLYVTNGGAKMDALLKFPSLMREVSRGDRLCPMIKVGNTYDGSGKLAISIGAFRFVCTNLSVGGAGCFAGGFLAFHAGKIDISVVGVELENYLVGFHKILDLYRQWQGTPSSEEAVRGILKGVAQRHAKAILEALRGNNVYDAYNVCTDYATHRMSSARLAFETLGAINRGFQEYYPAIDITATVIEEPDNEPVSIPYVSNLLPATVQEAR
ncbi:MAG: DUF932 domain-containing protein [Acidobacteriota bacterium]